MKICLVTTFPPSTGGLSEYGFHLAQELQRNPLLSLTVLADELPSIHSEPQGFTVLRCWAFDDPSSVFRLMRALHRLKPDVVWFNLLFQHIWAKSHSCFQWTHDPFARAPERALHARDTASFNGYRGTERPGHSSRMAVSHRGRACDPDVVAFEFSLGADARLSKNLE